MRKFYPKIKFVYSLPYDRLFNDYEGEIFTKKQLGELNGYIRKFQLGWNKISGVVFKNLKELTGNKWEEKEIKCYIVKNCKYGGISDPLTLRMEPDLEYACSILIHELTHIIVSYNTKKYLEIEKTLKKKFAKENLKTILHIYINFIEYQVLKKIFNQDIVNKIIKKSLKLKGLQGAWKIILNQENCLKDLFKEK